MKEKLFEVFISNYNRSSWHPCDIRRLHKYVEYCYENNVDEKEMVHPIIESDLSNEDKNRLIQNSEAVYEYLLLKGE